MSDTRSRKLEHVKVVLGKDVQFKTKTPMFSDVELIPRKAKVKKADTAAKFLGKKISAPIFVSGMTGGHEKLAKINMDIGEACSELGLPMGVGSQRAMIEKPELGFTFDVKKEHKDLILLANIGASHTTKYSLDRIEKMLDDVQANALCIHTNPGQEAAQEGGDIEFRGVPRAIADIAANLSRKVIVKEVGNGISKEVAQRLSKTKVCGIDTGGSGGTNWIAIELYRASGPRSVDIFREWGMPTAQSLVEVRSAFKGMVTATGGIRTAKDIAKAVALGADACGLAYPVLQAQNREGAKGVERYLRHLTADLEEEMLRLNCASIDELRTVGYSINGQLRNILSQRVDKKLLSRDG